MATETSDLFKTAVGITRDRAIPALKARAEREGLIISTCGWCNAYLGEQDGCGVSGLSTGICPKCLEAQMAFLPFCAACAAGYHEEIATEPCGCICHPI